MKRRPRLSASTLATGQVLERVAAEFNQLQFHAVQSKGLPLLDGVRPVSAAPGSHAAAPASARRFGRPAMAWGR